MPSEPAHDTVESFDPTTLLGANGCLGADGCPGGWLVASRIGVAVVRDPTGLVDRCDHFGFDMPIGLPATPGRTADDEARRFLGPRRSSVFSVPSRSLFDATSDDSSYVEANRLSRSLCAIGLSVQSFNLFPKIRALDTIARSIPLDIRDDRLLEVHPECSFREMTGRVLASKRSPEGRSERSAAIVEVFGAVPSTPRGARQDDVLDALAVLWSVERFARDDHRTLPADGDDRDAHGTLMRIVV